MAHEFGHGIAGHANEMYSWGLVATGAIFSRLALSSVALLPAIALGCVLSTITWRVMIRRWLTQRQEYEADVIGTAIAKAAECSSEDILYAMSCPHVRQHMVAEDMLTESGIPSHQQQVLASLRTLFPYGQLPKTIQDSRDNGLIKDTIATGQSTASAETLLQASKHLLELQMSLAQSLVYLRDPMRPWVCTHPHWLDRIAHVKASDYFQGAYVTRPMTRPMMSGLEAARVLKYRSGGQALLQAYQASSEWPAFITSLARDLPDEVAERRYSSGWLLEA